MTSFTSIDSNLIVGTNGEGVFITKDKGDLWKEISSELPRRVITCIASGGNNIFAGTDTAGVFHSTDLGAHWSQVIDFSVDSYYRYILSLASDGPNMFAGYVFGGVLRSEDQGNDFWYAANHGLPFRETVYSLMAQNGTVYAGMHDGVVCKSTDNGSNWKQISNVDGFSSSTVVAFAIIDSVLYAGTYGSGGIYRLSNDGKGWGPARGNGIKGGLVTSMVTYGKNLFIATDEGVFLTTDNATNWSSVNLGLANNFVDALIINDGSLFAGTDAGVWRRPLSEMINTNAVEKTPQSKLPVESFP